MTGETSCEPSTTEVAQRSDPGPGGEVGANCAFSTRLSGSDAESDGLSLKNQLGGEGAQTAQTQTEKREPPGRSATQLSDSEGGRNTKPRQGKQRGTSQTPNAHPQKTHRETHRKLWTTSQNRNHQPPPKAKKNLAQTYGTTNAKTPTGDPHAGPGVAGAGTGGLGRSRAGGSPVRWWWWHAFFAGGMSGHPMPGQCGRRRGGPGRRGTRGGGPGSGAAAGLTVLPHCRRAGLRIVLGVRVGLRVTCCHLVGVWLT